MTLDQTKIGDKVVVKRIDADDALRRRLYSFGVMRGQLALVKEFGVAHSTMKVQVGGMCIALRKEEAGKILVEREAEVG